MNSDNEKRLAAKEAVKSIKNGMIVGLGSGSTSAFMIKALGQQVADGLKIQCVPSSEETKKLAQSLNITLLELENVEKIDVNIDGADEFDPQMRLIKGGGGALLREKIVAHNSKYNIIIADSTKAVDRLGKFKLPVETIPFATRSIFRELESHNLKPHIRQNKNGNYKTDQKNDIIDLDIFEKTNLEELNQMLQNIPGIVETGLFLNTTDLIIYVKGESIHKIDKKEL
ncbi:MAG: ribose-5-phosphate isomerase RpiA [Leeuwenhoekiella sp.]